MAYQTFTHQIWWVMVCYDLVHQIRWDKHTFSGRCDITPMVCCSFGVHSTPQFLLCKAFIVYLIKFLIWVYLYSYILELTLRALTFPFLHLFLLSHYSTCFCQSNVTTISLKNGALYSTSCFHPVFIIQYLFSSSFVLILKNTIPLVDTHTHTQTQTHTHKHKHTHT